MNKELKKLEELLANDRKIIEDNYKEIVRLKELCNKYEEEHKTTFEEWKKTINIINELEKDLEGKIDEDRLNILSNSHWKYVLEKLQELKGNNNGVWVNNLLEVIKENNIEFGSEKE